MRAFVLLTMLLCPVPAAAQPEIAKATVTVNAPIYIQPGAQVPLRVANVGTSLKVLREQGDWLEVEFNDPQFGRRVGWVQRKLVQIVRPDLEPMDLSVKEPTRPSEPSRADLHPQAQRHRSPVMQDVRPERSKGWFDVNFGGAASAQRSVDTQVDFVDSGGELATMRVGYTAPAGASFDIGGGFMFTDVIGLGIQLTGTAHRHTADLAIRIPHPLYFDAHASDSGFTDEALDRVEGGINLSLVAAIPSSNRNVSVRVYGGPTYFRLEADAVSNIRYLQEFGVFTTANSVEIAGWERDKVEETGWGFHAGADLGYFFSRHFGVGGFARVTRGTVTFTTEQFLLNDDLDVTVGGFQGGGGLRVRF